MRPLRQQINHKCLEESGESRERCKSVRLILVGWVYLEMEYHRFLAEVQSSISTSKCPEQVKFVTKCKLQSIH